MRYVRRNFCHRCYTICKYRSWEACSFQFALRSSTRIANTLSAEGAIAIAMRSDFALNVARRRNFPWRDATSKSRHRRGHDTDTRVQAVSPFGVSRAEHSRRSICMLIRECLSGSGPLNNVMFIQRWYRCGRRGARHTRNRCHWLPAPLAYTRGGEREGREKVWKKSVPIIISLFYPSRDT